MWIMKQKKIENKKKFFFLKKKTFSFNNHQVTCKILALDPFI